jgi:hypothetical protein
MARREHLPWHRRRRETARSVSASWRRRPQQYVVADAAALGSDIKATGHVAVYGITFDTNKSVVPAGIGARGPMVRLDGQGRTDDHRRE